MLIMSLVRCMGKLIRFAHNRDRAVENIRMALSRQTLVMNASSRLVKSLVRRLNRLDLSLNPNGLIEAAAMRVDQMQKPGAFAVYLKPSRRSAKIFDLTGTSRLSACNAIASSSGRVHVSPMPGPSACLCMIKGVFINGREYKQGDCVEYFDRTAAARNREDRPEGSTESSKLGTATPNLTSFDISG